MKNEPQEVLPVWIHKFFLECPQSLDGSVNLKLYEKNNLIGNIDADWVSTDQGAFKAQLYNAAGQTLLNINYDNLSQKIELSGPLSQTLNNINVNKNGFIILQNNFIGIRITEIPCLLKFKFPFKWLTEYQLVKSSTNNFELHLKDNYGLYKQLNFNKNQFYEVSSIIGQITWRQFLFYKHNLFIKMTYNIQENGEMWGIQNYKIKWVNLDL